MAKQVTKPSPITVETFQTFAAPLTVRVYDVAGNEVFSTVLTPRQFESGSLGWYGGGSPAIKVDPTKFALPCHLGLNLTVNGTKGSK